MTFAIVDLTNQIGVGTVITLLGVAALFFAIRSNYSNIQANQIRALERQIGTDKSLLKDSEREVNAIRAQLTEQRSKTDLTSLQRSLDEEFKWKRATLEQISEAVSEGREEHRLIVETLGAISEAIHALATKTKEIG